MKTSYKIILKGIFFTYLLFFTPFFSALPSFIGLNEKIMTASIYEHDFVDQKISIKDQLNLLKVDKGVVLSDAKEKVEVSSGKYINNANVEQANTVVPKVSEGKKIYLYNTHQQETYSDGKSVVDASVLLANQLQEAGIQVVYETNDFPSYLKSNRLDYNSSYEASNYYLNEALVNYGGFDLVIDFHRDSVPRENAYAVVNNVAYAKMMFVVGGLSANNEHITNLSNQFSDSIGKHVKEAIKTPMIREAYYNQQVYKNSVLIEVGSDTNTFEEVSNSTNLLAQAIIQYLG